MAMRNPEGRGLLLTDSLCAPYTASPSAVDQPSMSLRSSHLLHDHGFSHGLLGCGDTCRLCLAQVYDLPVEFDADEHRHIEHLITSCTCVTLHAALLGISCLHRDLLHATAHNPAARAVVDHAFPVGKSYTDISKVQAHR